MTNKRAPFTRDGLDALYRKATRNGTGRGAVRWAAEVHGISRKTVQRWCAGAARPDPAQLARLQVVASVTERARLITAERLAERGLWGRLLAFFGYGLEQRVIDAAVQRELERREAQTRANLAFPGSWCGHDGETVRVGRRESRSSWLDSRSRNHISSN